jgi:hypothetical protein
MDYPLQDANEESTEPLLAQKLTQSEIVALAITETILVH